MVNRHGQRYLRDYNLGKPLDIRDPAHPQLRTMELGPRDRLSQAFVVEERKGNVLEGPYGTYVHLDIRHLGEKRINSKLPFVRELAHNYAGIDPVKEPIPVRPVVHYMMGGIDTAIDAATSLPGLYAAGECACVSINGANRLGSNSLTELLVFGARAGRNAANFARDRGVSGTAELTAQAEAEARRLEVMLHRQSAGRERIATIRNELTASMEAGAGIFREERSLRDTCNKLSELRSRYADLRLEDTTRIYNTELTAALELDFMLDAAQAVAFSALARRESRGSHQRTDFPERNDVDYLKHSLALKTDGEPRIQYKEVVITRWPPAERKYGA